MPRSGAGVYSRPSGTTPANGDTTDATQFNDLIDDMVDGLNDPALADYDSTITGDWTVSGNWTITGTPDFEELRGHTFAGEKATALSGTTPSIDVADGTVFTLTTSGNTTFTFTNPPVSTHGYAFALEITAGGTHTLTWPSSVEWAGGDAPDAPDDGETDVYVFTTWDGGTTWYGALWMDDAT